MAYALKLMPGLLIICNVGNSYAQDWTTRVIKNQQRVDLRDLGYAMVNEVPANSSAVTSLITHNNGMAYGCTSGESAYLFLFNPATNKAKHLGKIPGQTGVYHSLVEDKAGNLYIGSGKNMFEDLTLSKWGEGDEGLDVTLWKDIKKSYRNYPGGHLYVYDPTIGDDKVKLADMDGDFKDLGIPVPNNTIYALTINSKANEIYGITYPDGHFFTYSIALKKFNDLGEIDTQKVYHGPERNWRTLCRSLICDDAGRVFMSGNKGMLRYYDPEQKKLVTTQLEVPGDYYYMQFYTDYTAVEYFAKDADGLIYGGTTDGYLFSLDTKSMQIVNLGKVRESRRLRCLTVGHDGKVYLMAGERSSSRPCQFYAFNPKTHGFENLGLLVADSSPYYYWRGQQFDSMTTGADGTIYLGESERKSHLFLYIP